MISDSYALLFGGAIGNTGKFSITGDTYLCDLKTLNWKKLDRKPSTHASYSSYIAIGSQPSPRAAHASAPVESLQLVIYGGATGGNLNKVYNI